ncbi:MAG: AAA family ATPase [Mariprofundaceae bacterium]|nr:AAA family ATPase [Mariprofundaceae bacterium]
MSDSIIPDGIKINQRKILVNLEFITCDKSYEYEVSLNTEEKDHENTYSLSEHIKVNVGRSWDTIVNRSDTEIEVNGLENLKLTSGSMTPCLAFIFSLVSDKETLDRLKPVREYLKNIHYYPIDEPSGVKPTDIKNFVVDSDVYFKWLSEFQSSPDPECSVIMKLIHMWKDKEEKFEELKSLLGQNGLSIINDIRIDSLSLPHALGKIPKEEQTYYFVNFYPSLESDKISKVLRYHDLSYGTRRLLRMLTAILHDESTLLLLEQPEDSIHSGLLNKLVPLLTTYVDPSQFVVTSHSSGIINNLKAKDIRLVAMKDAKTIVRALTKVELEVVEAFICEEGTLNDFLESIEIEDV